MKGFLKVNEPQPFVDRIFSFSTNSATSTMLDLDQKHRLAQIFFEIQQIANQNEKKVRKRAETACLCSISNFFFVVSDKLENQLAAGQYITKLKYLSFLPVGVPKDPSFR